MGFEWKKSMAEWEMERLDFYSMKCQVLKEALQKRTPRHVYCGSKTNFHFQENHMHTHTHRHTYNEWILCRPLLSLSIFGLTELRKRFPFRDYFRQIKVKLEKFVRAVFGFFFLLRVYFLCAMNVWMPMQCNEAQKKTVIRVYIHFNIKMRTMNLPSN